MTDPLNGGDDDVEVPGDENPAPTRHPPPPNGNGARRASEVQVAQRVDQVYTLLMHGLGTNEIYRTVAKTAAEEKLARATAQRQRETFTAAGDADAAAKITVPPNVWGENGGPNTRTIDRYIQTAKQRFKTEAAQRAKEGDLVLGLQQRRLGYLFAQATSGKNKSLMTALATVQEINKLHGLHGAVKLQLAGLDGAPIQVEDVTKSSTTRAQDVAEIRRLLKLGAELAGIELPDAALTDDEEL